MQNGRRAVSLRSGLGRLADSQLKRRGRARRAVALLDPNAHIEMAVERVSAFPESVHAGVDGENYNSNLLQDICQISDRPASAPRAVRPRIRAARPELLKQHERIDRVGFGIRADIARRQLRDVLLGALYREARGLDRLAQPRLVLAGQTVLPAQRVEGVSEQVFVDQGRDRADLVYSRGVHGTPGRRERTLCAMWLVSSTPA
jgi:hypothetical protein